MLRFCDKEVCSVMKEDLNRRQLITYFLESGRDKIVCVLDSSNKFAGYITYNSLLGNELEDSINKEFVVLNEYIWENARKYFSCFEETSKGVEFLPVLNEKYELISFAWQDWETNRELRMLNELAEYPNALNFKDVYPEYNDVLVIGFNELTYFFVQYLMRLDIRVKVYMNDLWREFGVWESARQDDLNKFIVYGEGVDIQEEIIELRNSVSVEFECIDRIYEENIRKGIISNTDGDFINFLDKIRERQVAIIGIGESALNAFDLLLENGIDIYCFISENNEEKNRKMFGKRILGKREAVADAKHITFVNPDFKYSSWGSGQVDLYHYFGFKRNEQIFLLKDYAEIHKNGLKNILKYLIEKTDRRVILTGDIAFCIKLQHILEGSSDRTDDKIFYCDLQQQSDLNDKERIRHIEVQNISATDSCLVLIPECYGISSGNICLKQKQRNEIYKMLLSENIIDIIEYNTENNAFMCFSEDHNGFELKVGKVLIGAINYYSGNTLFRSILDNHPDVLMINNYYLSNNLFSICVRLSVEKSQDIVSSFWNIYYREKVEGAICEIEKRSSEFNKYMEELLTPKEIFSSWELFIIFHIAYAKINGYMVKDISKIAIYWEPHEVSRDVCEDYSLWLTKVSDNSYIVNIVRDTCISYGSMLNYFLDNKNFAYSGKRIFQSLLHFPNEEKYEYDGWERIVIKFEELKCKKEEVIKQICGKIGIIWSDTLLKTTRNGKQLMYRGITTGFDLSPVYNTYEEYFSTFDHFRISLITGLWRKRYGYSYINSLTFTRRELRKIFLMPFRFEERLVFSDYDEKRRFRKWVLQLSENILWDVRYFEVMNCLIQL